MITSKSQTECTLQSHALYSFRVFGKVLLHVKYYILNVMYYAFLKIQFHLNTMYLNKHFNYKNRNLWIQVGIFRVQRKDVDRANSSVPTLLIQTFLDL